MPSDSDLTLAELLKNKEPAHAEIEMQLFENCNLSCAFCSQNHIAPSEDASLPKLLRKFDLAREYISIHPSREFRINMMGGEIFQDKFPDSHLDNLFTLVSELNKLCQEKGKLVQFMFTTNMIFEKVERLKHFLQKIDLEIAPISLATSFDFVGRTWTTKQKELFQRNAEIFAERIQLVGVVLQKPSIKKLIETKDPLFDWLYERLPIVFEYYIPDLNHQDVFSPSDEENLQAWRYIAKHYPKAEPIHRWLNNNYNEVKCCSMNRLTILADDTISSCRYMPYKPADFKTDLDRHSISGMALKFLSEQNCLTCNHFNRCGLHCFVQADRAAREQRESCFVREFFDESLAIGVH